MFVGRGKSIIAEVEIDEEILLQNFKCTAAELSKLNINKNLIGSCVAGSIGGFNAHAANIVAACFIACGQDPAQVIIKKIFWLKKFRIFRLSKEVRQ